MVSGCAGESEEGVKARIVDTYKGESPAKKIARRAAWTSMIRSVGGSVGNKSVMFLASREGGDVPVLRALGVCDAQMIAVERCASAAESFAARYPDVKLFVGDIADAVRVYSQSLACVFADFCSCVSLGLHQTSVAIMLSVKSSTAVAFAVMRGREGKISESHVWDTPRNRHQRRRDASVFRYDEAAKRHNRARHVNGSKVMDIVLQGKDGAAEDDRIYGRLYALLDDYEKGVCSPSGKAIWVRPMGSVGTESEWYLDHVITYQSETSESHGVPLAIGCFAPSSYRDAWLERMRNGDDTSCRDLTMWTRVGRVSTDDIRDEICSGAKPESLNVSPSTAAAWRAHATRGTYMNRDACER